MGARTHVLDRAAGPAPRRARRALFVATLFVGSGVLACREQPAEGPGDAPAPDPVAAPAVGPDAEGARQVVRLLNTAKGLLENGDGAAALAPLGEARDLMPALAATWRNTGRAYLLEGQVNEALAALGSARERDPDSVAAAYLLGAALARAERWDESVVELEAAVRGDPSIAAARFQLGQALDAVGRADEAVEQWTAAVELDPAHAAAHFALALAGRKGGDMAAFREHNLEFLRLRELYGETHASPVALEACLHTKAEPAPWVGSEAGMGAPAEQLVVRFAVVDEQLPRARAVAVLAMDDRGLYTLVTIDEAGRLSLLEPSDEGDLQPRAMSPDGTVPEGAWRLAVGNIADALPAEAGSVPRRQADVLAYGPGGLLLWQRAEDGGLVDVTGRAGLFDLTAASACWTDIDHDGDLDLALVGADGLAILQNQGGGLFDDAPEDMGVPATGPGVAVASADLDDNAALDLVVARGAAPTLLVENRRAGRLGPGSSPPGPWPAARGVLLDDLDNDGRPDAVLSTEGAVELLFGGPGGAVPGPRLPLGETLAHDLALVDYDNDGWLDLVVAGEEGGRSRVRLFRNAGREPWTELGDTLGLEALSGRAPLADVLAADLDGDGDSDLLLRGSDGALTRVDNQGGAGNGQLKLRLVSLMNTGGALGAHVEVRREALRVSRFPSVDAPIEIGVGQHALLDSVLTVWPDGVVETSLEVDPHAGPHTVAIVRKVDTGSCPFLYAWDGEGYRFLNDLVGASPVGVPLARGVPMPSQPKETLVLGPGALVPDDGELRLRMSCELREVFYLDHTRLRAVDHDPDVEIHTTHMLCPPPFPSGELVALADLTLPRAARREDGTDVTAALVAADGQCAPPGEVLAAPYRGTCRPWSLTLDFDAPPGSGPRVLALTGWLQWTTSSSNIALSQDPHADARWPVLEVLDDAGGWRRLEVQTGLPAGKGKTVLYALPDELPERACRLRLSTSFEVHWDRIALARRRAVSPAQVSVLPFGAADLQWQGFGELRARGPGRPPTPDPTRITDTPPWLTAAEGWCTAYGDVTGLCREADGQLVVLNAGDAVTLRASVDTLPPLAPGTERTWVLDTVGSAKENDVNCVAGQSVGPLPGADPDPAWRLRHNTRWVPADRFAR